MSENKKQIIDVTGTVQNYTSCMGCSIENGELKPYGDILFEDENFYVCQDFEVPIVGFIIISTKSHLCSINDFSSDQKVNFIMLVDKVLKALKTIGVAQEFILVQGERNDIHFHTSLFPRKEWMKEKFGRVISNLKQIQDYAIENMKTPENLSEIAKICKLLKEELNK